MAMPPPEGIDTMEDESLSARLLAKGKKNPFLVAGILGCLTTVAIGAYRFKNRNKQFPISVYLIQLRVAAQSAVIGTLTLGMTYGMLNEYVFNKKSKPGIQEK